MPDTRTTSDFTNTDRLAEIEAREAAATAGPWGLEGGEEYDGHGPLFLTSYSKHVNLNVDHLSPPDADFIAHGRVDIPWLIVQLKQARGLAAALMEDDVRRDDEAGITSDPDDRRRRIYIDGEGTAWIDCAVANDGTQHIIQIDEAPGDDVPTSQVSADTGNLREIGRCW